MAVNEGERGPYKMRTISRLTDFSPALLRAWERRHQLLEPMRGPGGHRMYTEEDLQVLLRVKDLMRQGRSIGEIAGVGRSRLLEQRAEKQRIEELEPQPLPATGPEVQRELERWQQRIVDSAVALDSGEINRALDETFARVSAETAIFEVIKPSAQKIGELWIAGKCSVASEHLASGIFVHRLRKLVETAEPARSPYAPVIVACFPDEYHQLGALMLAYQLARNGLRVSFLGAALPLIDLEGACDVIQPAAVLLSVTRRAVYQVHRKELSGALARRSGKTLFYLGGQGVPVEDPAVARTGAALVSAQASLEDTLKDILNRVRDAGPRIF